MYRRKLCEDILGRQQQNVTAITGDISGYTMYCCGRRQQQVARVHKYDDAVARRKRNAGDDTAIGGDNKIRRVTFRFNQYAA